MACKVVPLTDTTIRTAEPRGDGGIKKLSDGDGLQFWVMPGGVAKGHDPGALKKAAKVAVRAASERTFNAILASDL